jgi:hypothetical protein
MMLAWLSLDLVLIVLFAFSLPAAFLYVIRRWLQNSEQAEVSREHQAPNGSHPTHS